MLYLEVATSIVEEVGLSPSEKPRMKRMRGGLLDAVVF